MKYICDSCEKYPCSADETKLRLSCPAYSPKPKPITNYDLLIRKTPEEMAEFISGKARTFGEEYEGYMSALDWLKEEASDGLLQKL